MRCFLSGLMFLFGICICHTSISLKPFFSRVANGSARRAKCHGGFDIYFVLDKSGSITTEQFQQQTVDFVAEIVSSFDSTNVRVSFIIFGQKSNLILPLTGNESAIDEGFASLRLVRPMGQTRLSKGLRKANQQIEEHGGGSPSIIIAFTDGLLGDTRRAEQEAKRTREYGGSVLVVRIAGGQVPIHKLYLIADPPAYKHTFTGETVDDLHHMVADVVKASCVEVLSVSPSTVCSNEVFNVSVHGSGFDKGVDRSMVSCNFRFNETDTPVRPIVQRADYLLCQAPPIPDSIWSVDVQVSINGRSYVSGNGNIYSTRCLDTAPAHQTDYQREQEGDLMVGYLEGITQQANGVGDTESVEMTVGEGEKSQSPSKPDEVETEVLVGSEAEVIPGDAVADDLAEAVGAEEVDSAAEESGREGADREAVGKEEELSLALAESVKDVTEGAAGTGSLLNQEETAAVAASGMMAEPMAGTEVENVLEADGREDEGQEVTGALAEAAKDVAVVMSEETAAQEEAETLSVVGAGETEHVAEEGEEAELSVALEEAVQEMTEEAAELGSTFNQEETAAQGLEGNLVVAEDEAEAVSVVESLWATEEGGDEEELTVALIGAGKEVTEGAAELGSMFNQEETSAQESVGNLAVSGSGAVGKPGNVAEAENTFESDEREEGEVLGALAEVVGEAVSGEAAELEEALIVDEQGKYIVVTMTQAEAVELEAELADALAVAEPGDTVTVRVIESAAQTEKPPAADGMKDEGEMLAVTHVEAVEAVTKAVTVDSTGEIVTTRKDVEETTKQPKTVCLSQPPPMIVPLVLSVVVILILLGQNLMLRKKVKDLTTKAEKLDSSSPVPQPGPKSDDSSKKLPPPDDPEELRAASVPSIAPKKTFSLKKVTKDDHVFHPPKADTDSSKSANEAETAAVKKRISSELIQDRTKNTEPIGQSSDSVPKEKVIKEEPVFHPPEADTDPSSSANDPNTAIVGKRISSDLIQDLVKDVEPTGQSSESVPKEAEPMFHPPKSDISSTDAVPEPEIDGNDGEEVRLLAEDVKERMEVEDTVLIEEGTRVTENQMEPMFHPPKLDAEPESETDRNDGEDDGLSSKGIKDHMDENGTALTKGDTHVTNYQAEPMFHPPKPATASVPEPEIGKNDGEEDRLSSKESNEHIEREDRVSEEGTHGMDDQSCDTTSDNNQSQATGSQESMKPQDKKLFSFLHSSAKGRPGPKPPSFVRGPSKVTKWPTVDTSMISGPGMRPVKITWGSSGATQAALHLVAAKDAKVVGELEVETPGNRVRVEPKDETESDESQSQTE